MKSFSANVQSFLIAAITMAMAMQISSLKGSDSKEKESLKPGERREITVNNMKIGFRWCPPGKFMMGSPETEAERKSDETQHEVVLTKGFWMMETEVTQELYDAITCFNWSKFRGEKMPMQGVSWFKAVEFCNKMSEIADLSPAYKIETPQNEPDKEKVSIVPDANGFRLPTEAQWEYACRAGTNTVFSWGDSIDPSLANYDGNSPYNKGEKGNYVGKPSDVGSYKPNAWGLYDMHGNLWEWCWDWYGPYSSNAQNDPTSPDSGQRRAIRGGCWRYKAGNLRSAARFNEPPDRRWDLIGFRMVVPELKARVKSFKYSTPKTIVAKLSAKNYPTIEERADAVYKGAMVASEYEGVKGNSPMHYWIARMLFEKRENEKALSIISQGIKEARKAIEYRESINHPMPGYNGFIYWGLLNCYVKYQQKFTKEILDDYRYVFTHAKNYSGSTGNLSMIHTLALYLADNIWGPENLPKDGRFGARGPKAIPWFDKRIKYVAGNGSGEFASRPYMIYNVGTLLTLDNPLTDKDLANRAKMAYEMSLAHDAGTWLRGNWATPAGRSYPDDLSQVPGGGAAMLWFYFGGMTPDLGTQNQAIFALAEDFRPHPLIINAATDRSKPYVHRSRFDGTKAFQTSFVNKTYALFSTATPPGVGVWGQCYPYGVMYDQPDREKCSFLWLSVPCYDDKPLTNWTHGVATRSGQFLQNEGSFILVCKDLKNPKYGFKDRVDDKGNITNKTFKADERYILSRIPGGYKAMINESKETGRIFFNYGSVLVAILSTEKFDWDPKAKVYCGASHPDDSEFRIFGDNLAAAFETARPDEYPGNTPEEKLQAFRNDILAKSKLTCSFKANPDGQIEIPKGAKDFDRSIVGMGVVTGTYTDRFGNVLEKIFDGDAKVNGKVIDYESWPLIDNPWVHQERNGAMTVTDGKTTRIYDMTTWTITEKKND